MKQCIGYNSIIRNNMVNITYAYNIIDDNGVIIKSNIHESFILLPKNNTDLIAANNTILVAINTRINPVIPVVTGKITINYVDENLANLETPTVLDNLPLATYYYTAKDFLGYTLAGNNIQSTILDSNNLNMVITFNYTKIVA